MQEHLINTAKTEVEFLLEVQFLQKVTTALE